MSVVQLSLDDALAARERGMTQVLHHSDTEYREALCTAIRTLASTGRNFCSDDLREFAGDAPVGCSPNIAGAVVAGAAREGLIELVGYTHSARVVGHGNLVRLWRGRK